MPLDIREHVLEAGEWIEEAVPKDTIFLHHTAGGHRPDWVVAGWNRDRDADDKRQRIATAFVIGGTSTRDGDTDWDGVIVQCFPEAGWSYHLGVRGTRGALDRKSIGIELCNYGPLTRSTDGRFFNYVDKPVPANQVVELGRPFRGNRFYHRYTDAQIESARGLISQLAVEHDIDVTAGLVERLGVAAEPLPDGLDVLEQQKWLNRRGFVGKDGLPLEEDGIDGANTRFARRAVLDGPFGYNLAARGGAPGLWTHTNVRRDKTDCSPQPALLAMLDSL